MSLCVLMWKEISCQKGQGMAGAAAGGDDDDERRKRTGTSVCRKLLSMCEIGSYWQIL